MKDSYRKAASLLLLRPGEKGFDVLLLHKPRKRDSWQLPQGGVEEKETAEECAVRELREEAGIEHVTILGKSALVYTYDFPASYRRFRPDHICGQRIEFVYALCDTDVQVNVDGVEIDRYRWVHPSQVARMLKRKEYVELVSTLLQEAMALLPT